jgi:drug/metabolite transporter (DMT)-like permease
VPSFPFDGYVYLAIAAVCSIGIGVMFKVAALRSIDQTNLIYTNYVVATIAGLLVAGARISDMLSRPDLVLLAVGTGFLFILGFYAMGRATKVAGVALTLSSWRMSVVIPFVASWIIWGEDPTRFQLLGLLVAVAGFVLISNPFASGEGDSRRSVWILLFVFVIGGIVDTLFKTITENFASQDDILSVSCLIFASAAMSMTIPVGIRTYRGKTKGVANAVVPGIFLGLLNLGSIVFLLAALDSIPGTVVFPVNNISVVAGAAILGTVVWDEGLSRSARIGVGFAVVSLVLLTSGL